MEHRLFHRPWRTKLLACTALVMSLVAPQATFAEGEEAAFVPVSTDDVRVTRSGDGFRIEVVMQTPTSIDIAWQVLTDFGQMAHFVQNLERSDIVSQNGNRLRVAQQGTAYYGPFSMAFSSVRDIELRPKREILARQVSGTAKSMESVMRLTPTTIGTRLEYRAEVVPEGFLPPLVGPAAIRGETAEQFSAILVEMLRRDAARQSAGKRQGETSR